MKSTLKKLRLAFAPLALGVCATPAAAQDSAPATTEATPAPQAPAAPSTDLPDLTTFHARDYLRGSDPRLPLYQCADNSSNCWSEEERTALDVREFWQMLNVTALGCRSEGMQDLPDAYNTFLQHHTGFLTAQYNMIDAHFIAKLGAERAGKRAHDSLSTSVMNLFSSATPRAGYCEATGQILRHVATVQDTARLTEIAREVMAGSRGTYAPNDPPPPIVRPQPPVPPAPGA